MIVEGFVKLKQDNNELILKNHLTANTATYLIAMMLWRYSGAYYLYSPSQTGHVYQYLMNTFQIRLGSGITQIPSHDLTTMESQLAICTGNTTVVNGDYDTAEPFDVVYSAQIDSLDLVSAFAGVTITSIANDVIAIQSDPPTSPTSGDTYIVGASATGDWAGYENYIAEWTGTIWNLISPDTTWAASISGTPNVPYRFDGTDWIEITNKVTEVGLFTYGYKSATTYRWYLYYEGNGSVYYGNAYWLAAYISANATENPDFSIGDIDICRTLVIEWTIRVSFVGD